MSKENISSNSVDSQTVCHVLLAGVSRTSLCRKQIRFRAVCRAKKCSSVKPHARSERKSLAGRKQPQKATGIFSGPSLGASFVVIGMVESARRRQALAKNLPGSLSPAVMRDPLVSAWQGPRRPATPRRSRAPKRVARRLAGYCIDQLRQRERTGGRRGCHNGSTAVLGRSSGRRRPSGYRLFGPGGLAADRARGHVEFGRRGTAQSDVVVSDPRPCRPYRRSPTS